MIAAIGDIHGCFDAFQRLFLLVVDKYFIHRIVLLGDFIDRGPESKKVVDYILQVMNKSLFTILRGNHEDMLIDFVNNEGRYPNNEWIKKEGLETIASFTGKTVEEAVNLPHDEVRAVFKNYMNFFQRSQPYFVEQRGRRKFLFSHAGVNSLDKPIERQYDGLSPEQQKILFPFLWSRNVMNFDKQFFDFTIVHGHTPVHNSYKPGEVPRPVVRKDGANNLINVDIDTGCCYGGSLSAMIIDNDGAYTFETVECLE